MLVDTSGLLRNRSRANYRFLVGQTGSGRWIVADRLGLIGGLFIDRKSALHFVKVESSGGQSTDSAVAEVGRLEIADIFAVSTAKSETYQ